MPHEFCLFDKMIDFKKRAQTLLGTSFKKSLAEKITSELTYGCCNSTDDKLEYVLFLFVSLSTAYAAFKENLKVKELRWFTLSWPYKPLFKKNHTQQNPNHLPYSLINNVGKILYKCFGTAYRAACRETLTDSSLTRMNLIRCTLQIHVCK